MKEDVKIKIQEKYNKNVYQFGLNSRFSSRPIQFKNQEAEITECSHPATTSKCSCPDTVKNVGTLKNCRLSSVASDTECSLLSHSLSLSTSYIRFLSAGL